MLTSFIDFNDNRQLGKFGLHNGSPNDRNHLSEKWEGVALARLLDPETPRDFFRLSATTTISSRNTTARTALPYTGQSSAGEVIE